MLSFLVLYTFSDSCPHIQVTAAGAGTCPHPSSASVSSWVSSSTLSTSSHSWSSLTPASPSPSASATPIGGSIISGSIPVVTKVSLRCWRIITVTSCSITVIHASIILTSVAIITLIHCTCYLHFPLVSKSDKPSATWSAWNTLAMVLAAFVHEITVGCSCRSRGNSCVLQNSSKGWYPWMSRMRDNCPYDKYTCVTRAWQSYAQECARVTNSWQLSGVNGLFRWRYNQADPRNSQSILATKGTEPHNHLQFSILVSYFPTIKLMRLNLHRKTVLNSKVRLRARCA